MIQIICFSRKRPLQLHGYLTSLFAHCRDKFHVSVLVRMEEPYAQAYSDMSAEFPQVGWFPEGQDFAALLSGALDLTDAELTMFGCDDVTFINHFEPAAISQLLTEKPELLGVSLRLGQNITEDMFGQPLMQPEISDLTWDMTHYRSVGDWAYPWEVLGTVYRTDYVKEMVTRLNAGSPSQLEERGSRDWRRMPQHHMAMYPTSRLVVPTVNVIQTEFPGNGTIGEPMTPEFLLDCWNNGLRMDTERYKGMEPPSWRIGEFYLKRAT